MSLTLSPPPTSLQAKTLELTLSRTVLWFLPILLVSIPLAYAAFQVFPLYDDGWLSMLLKEARPEAIARGIPDRPLFGHLLQLLSSFGEFSKPIFVAVSALLWIVLAFQSATLWERLFPEFRRYAPVAACLTLAPIVASAQLCTVLITLPCVLPSVLAYGALLLLLRHVANPCGFVWWSLAVVPLALGVLLSEYALAASCVVLVLLSTAFLNAPDPGQRRRALQATVLTAMVVAIAYLVFLRVSDLSVRPTVAPGHAGLGLRRNAIGIVLNLMNGMWHSVAGVYGTALNAVALYGDSKSSIIAVLYGVTLAAALVYVCRAGIAEKRPQASLPSTQTPVLLFALLLGLLPVAIMGRVTTLQGFPSRFLIPILPIAVAATLSILLRWSRERHRWVVVALMGLICGNAAITHVRRSVQNHQFMVSVGDTMKPYVSPGGNYTVAVMSASGMDYEMTGKATLAWDAAFSRKFWLYDAEAGEKALGSRTSCTGIKAIRKDLRELKRIGGIDHLLWVEVKDFKLISVEPYCRQVSLNVIPAALPQ